MAKLRGNAAVLGASMGGLLAAEVLAESYETVTVVERDVLPDTPREPTPKLDGRRCSLRVAKVL